MSEKMMKYFDDNSAKVIFLLKTSNYFQVNEKETLSNMLNLQQETPTYLYLIKTVYNHQQSIYRIFLLQNLHYTSNTKQN